MEPVETWHLATRHIGRRVLLFESLDSTNSYAAKLGNDPTNDGVAVIAHEQTVGRGQHGRSWHSPRGESLLLSVLLFPPPDLRRPVVLAAWTAVAVCETIHSVAGLPASIKWPNDVLIHDQKACGILIEQGRGTVAGLGLNLNQTKQTFRQAGLPKATSLSIECGQVFDVPAVARELLQRLDEAYLRLCHGDHLELEACWKRLTRLIGKEVVVELQDSSLSGQLIELNWNALQLRVSDDIVRIIPERIKHIRLL